LAVLYLTENLIRRKSKELQKVNTKRSSPINKWVNELNRQYSKEEQTVSNNENVFRVHRHQGNVETKPHRDPIKPP
jgi:type II secretory pathway component PulC